MGGPALRAVLLRCMVCLPEVRNLPIPLTFEQQRPQYRPVGTANSVRLCLISNMGICPPPAATLVGRGGNPFGVDKITTMIYYMPIGGERMKVNITLNDELLEKIDKKADDMFMSRSGFIALSCTEKLQNMEAIEMLGQMTAAFKAIAATGTVDEETQVKIGAIVELFDGIYGR